MPPLSEQEPRSTTNPHFKTENPENEVDANFPEKDAGKYWEASDMDDNAGPYGDYTGTKHYSDNEMRDWGGCYVPGAPHFSLKQLSDDAREIYLGVSRTGGYRQGLERYAGEYRVTNLDATLNELIERGAIEYELDENGTQRLRQIYRRIGGP